MHTEHLGNINKKPSKQGNEEKQQRKQEVIREEDERSPKQPRETQQIKTI